MKKIFIGICMIVLLATAVFAAVQTYETTAVSRIVGDSPVEMERQLEADDIDLRHATYQNLVTPNTNRYILQNQFGSNINDMNEQGLNFDQYFDQEDLDQFQNNELLFLENTGRITSDRVISLYDTSNFRSSFNQNKPLFLFNSDYAGITIPKKESLITDLTEDSVIIAPTFKRSNEFMKSALCNLRSDGRTAGETFRQARNYYHWHTNKNELIGLTLFSYHLFGNPLIELESPNYNLNNIKSYCGEYLDQFSAYEITSMDGFGVQSLIDPFVKTVTVNLGSHSLETYDDHSILEVDGAIQDFVYGELVLPKRIDTHEFPLKTVITNVSLISKSNAVNVNIYDLPEWQDDFIDRNCWNSSNKVIDYTHSFTEDSEVAIVRINPVEIIDCEAGQFKLYKRIVYEIKYIPYSPVLIETLDYPEKIAPGETINLDVTVSNVQGSATSGDLIVKNESGGIVAQKSITTSITQFNLQFEAPNNEGINHYSIEFVQNSESMTQAKFDFEVVILDGNLIIPKTGSSSLNVDLQLYNHLSSNLNVQVKSNLLRQDTVISTQTYPIIVNPGDYSIYIPFSGLNAQDKFYKAVIDLIYDDNIKTITGSIIVNNPPNLNNVADMSVVEGDNVVVTVSASDPDGDSLTYSISDPNFAQTSLNQFEWQTQIGDVGDYIISYGASDGVDTSTNSFNLEITESIQDCNDISDGRAIYDDTTLCPGEYNLFEGGIVIAEDDVVLDCNGAVLIGNHSHNSYGIRVWGYRNAVIKNCIVKNYMAGISIVGFLTESPYAIIENNNLQDNVLGVMLLGATDAEIRYNEIRSTGNYNANIWARDSFNNKIYSNDFYDSIINDTMINNNTYCYNNIDNNYYDGAQGPVCGSCTPPNCCLSGETRQCGDSDVGICEYGTEICTDYEWGGCVGAVYPVGEICDEVDNNCDGDVDEGCDCVNGETQQCGLTNIGQCEYGTETCIDGQWQNCNAVWPLEEVCDGIDNDCNTVIDDGCICIHGDTRQCGFTDQGTCQFGTETCSNGQWINCNAIFPADEDCDNSLDDDCDGFTDINDNQCQSCVNGETQFCAKQLGVCLISHEICTNYQWHGCDYNLLPYYESTETSCDGLDNDCDGETDVGCECIDGQIESCGESVGRCIYGNRTCTNGRWSLCWSIPPIDEICNNNEDDDCDSFTDMDDDDCINSQVRVNFRIYDLDFRESNNAIAFSTLCGEDLIAYGRETALHTSYECENDPNHGALIINDLPSNDPYSPAGDGIWKLYYDYADINEVWMCQNDADGDGSTHLRFDTRSSYSSLVSTIPIMENNVFENLCSSTCFDNDADGFDTCGNNNDCDDNNENVYPGGNEICDTYDNDCDGEVDEDLNETTNWRDGDNLCTQTTLCQNGELNIGVVCSIDSDNDDDGYNFVVDCDDNNPNINPGVDESCYDSIDNDCDGDIDFNDNDCSDVIHVNFRTTDLRYYRDSAVGYISNCGSFLRKYGHSTIITSSGYTCDTYSRLGEKLVSNLPHEGHLYNQNDGDGMMDLYEYVYNQHTVETAIAVCEDDADGWGISLSLYYAADSDASRVSNNPNLNDLLSEHICTPGYEDSDNDGVYDTEDACPNNYGTYCNGCPELDCGSCATLICLGGDAPYCSNLPASTICGTNNCDFMDLDCVDFHDTISYCDGLGNCQIPPCSSFSYKPTTTQCGSDHWEYGCPWGNDFGADAGRRLHDYHCDGEGSCLDYVQGWQIDERCDDFDSEFCEWDGSGNSDGDYYCESNCVDNDNDGYGINCFGSEDCNDANPNIHPNANEVCDGLDNDCDGSIDEDIGCQCISGETEQCGSSDIGRCSYGTETCVNNDWGSCEGDIDPINEICDNNIDDNCDGDIDEGCGGSCVTPTDGEVFTQDTILCSGTYNLPNGIRMQGGSVVLDCNSAVLQGSGSNYGIRPYGNYNVIKNCVVNNYQWGITLGNYAYNQILYNTITNNERGIELTGINNNISYNIICDNIADFRTYSVPNEGDYRGDENTCDNSQLWNDDGTTGCTYSCSGAQDNDNDGYSPPIDCDDDNAAINPGAIEVCDGVDNDCDGDVDEDLNSLLCELQQGVCQGSIQVCVSDGSSGGGQGVGGPGGGTGSGGAQCTANDYGSDYESTETSCDGLDNDCDGEVDEDCGSDPIEPTDGMVITDDTVFVEGDYYIPNGITIDADDIEIDFNGAVFQGTGLHSRHDEKIAAMDLTNVDNVLIKNAEINDYDYGFYLDSTQNITFEENFIDGNYVSIMVIDSLNTTIENNDLIGGMGIAVMSSSQIRIDSNTIDTGSHGIYLWNSPAINPADNWIFYNDITTSGDGAFGIKIESSANTVAWFNNIITQGSDADGMYLSVSPNSDIQANNIRTSGKNSDGFILNSQNDSKIIYNNISVSGAYESHYIGEAIRKWNSYNNLFIGVEPGSNTYTIY